MASSLRQSPRAPAAQPPALHDRALQDLSFIRHTMEGASSFTDVPGWGLVAIGVTAIIAAVIAATQVTAGRWLSVWLVEAVVGALLGGGMMWRKMRRRVRSADAPLLSVPARKFLFGFWPAILAGAILTFALINVQHVFSDPRASVRALPGLWLVLYGVGVTTAGAFSVRAVPLMGAGFIAIGTVALFAQNVSGDFLLALGFGAWQAMFGVWIARRHGG